MRGQDRGGGGSPRPDLPAALTVQSQLSEEIFMALTWSPLSGLGCIAWYFGSAFLNTVEIYISHAPFIPFLHT